MLRDPALIIWLDGQRNTRQAPNENLARELMELFTLGIGALHRGRHQGRRPGADRLDHRPGDRHGQPRAEPARRRRARPSSARPPNFDADSYAELLVGPAGPRRVPGPAAVVPVRLGRAADRRDAGPRWPRAYRAGPRRRARCSRRCCATPPSPTSAASWSSSRWSGWSARCGSSACARAPSTEDQRRQLLGGLDGLGQVPLRPPSVGGWPAGAAWLTTSSLQVRLRLAAGWPRRPAPALWTARQRLAGGAARRAGPPAGRRRLDRPHPDRADRGRRRPAPAAHGRSGQPRVHGQLRRPRGHHDAAQVPHRQRRRRRRRAGRRRGRATRWRTSSPRPATRAGRPATVPWSWSRCTAATTASPRSSRTPTRPTTTPGPGCPTTPTRCCASTTPPASTRR